MIATDTIEAEQFASPRRLRQDVVPISRRHRSDDDLVDRASEVDVLADWYVVSIRQLDVIDQLPPGWDSNGGDSPDHAMVESAKSLLYSLSLAIDVPKPHINPTPSGGVQIEWDNDSQHFEIEIVKEGCATFFFQDAGEAIEDEGEVYSGGALDGVIKHLGDMFRG